MALQLHMPSRSNAVVEVTMLTRSIGAAVTAAFVAGIVFGAPADPRAAGQANADKGDMTLVGCLIKESDYRAAHGFGKGGIAGVRTGSDFVLVDASVSVEGARATASGSCSEKGTGDAYRLAGKAEGKLKPFAGRYVEITGRFEHPRDTRIAAGQIKSELPPEIIVVSYRAPAGGGEPVASNPPAARATSEPPAANNQPVAEARALPKTASAEPLVAVFGMLCLGIAASIGLLRLRFAR
jgi:hypothetical protein